MLSKQATETYQFIKRYIAEHGYAPSLLEIAEGIGIKSKGVAHRYVASLEEAGLIKIIPGKKRNIVLCDNKTDLHLPLLGQIAAGKPIETFDEREQFDFSQLIGADRFVLKVKGDSMIEENICDGDLVICEKTNNIKNGDIVVALIDNSEVTLKTIQYHQNNTISLIPANANLSPMIYPSNRIDIQAKFMGLIRLSP